MAKLIMWNMMTLDGLIEGPNREIDWHEHVWGEELEAYSKEVGRAAGGLLFGRMTYALMAGYWPTAKGEIAQFMNALPKIVFSRSLESADWINTRLVRENVPDEVRKLKEETDKDLFVFGSADLSATLIRHGLFDEYRIGINPIVLGGGNPLFKETPDRLRLTLTESRPLRSGVVILHYRPA
jgi:dihydrofolate reductase